MTKYSRQEVFKIYASMQIDEWQPYREPVPNVESAPPKDGISREAARTIKSARSTDRMLRL
ncbi:MAG: hypothetical protein ABI634_20090 [Acidobacteriota bacterium]